MKPAIYRVLLAGWTVVVLVLTGYPSLETPKIKEFPVDKIYHFAAFLILGMLARRVLRTGAFFAFCGAAVIVAEIQQIFIPGRDFELLDIVAGAAGFAAVFAVGRLRRRKINHELSKA